MEGRLKEVLGVSSAKRTGRGGGGCINDGETWELSDGRLVFVKVNGKSEARRMFDGEYASLRAMEATGTIKVPHAIAVLDMGSKGAALVMENLNFGGRQQPEALGRQLAEMHKYNQDVKERLVKKEQRINKLGEEEEYVDKFGFDVTTCCGYLPMDNAWQEDWPTFFTRQRLKSQVERIEKTYGDRECLELWSRLSLAIPKFFDAGVEIVPALLHGDLWSGNASVADGVPVIFDPACFYGHSEYEFGIMNMFGGFHKSEAAYFKVLPKQPMFDKRVRLYELFHHLNHWNHFGSGYRSGSLSIMKELIK